MFIHVSVKRVRRDRRGYIQSTNTGETATRGKHSKGARREKGTGVEPARGMRAGAAGRRAREEHVKGVLGVGACPGQVLFPVSGGGPG